MNKERFKIRDKKMLELAKQGIYPKDIAIMFNIDIGRVRRILEKENTDGIDLKKIRKQVKTNNHIIKAEQLARQSGRIPTGRELRQALGTSSHAFINICREALLNKGFEYKDKQMLRRFSNDELLNDLKQLAKQLGRTPTAMDINRAGKRCYATYEQHFGSVCKAQKAAGLVANKPGKDHFTDDELLNHLKQLAKQLGRTPTIKDIHKAHKVNQSTYRTRFGSLIKAQQLAGLIPNKRGRK